MADGKVDLGDNKAGNRGQSQIVITDTRRGGEHRQDQKFRNQRRSQTDGSR